MTSLSKNLDNVKPKIIMYQEFRSGSKKCTVPAALILPI